MQWHSTDRRCTELTAFRRHEIAAPGVLCRARRYRLPVIYFGELSISAGPSLRGYFDAAWDSSSAGRDPACSLAQR